MSADVYPLKSVEEYEHLTEIIERVTTALQDFPELDYVYIGAGGDVDDLNRLMRFWDKTPTYFDVYLKLTKILEYLVGTTPKSFESPYPVIDAVSRMKTVSLDEYDLLFVYGIKAPILEYVPAFARRSLNELKKNPYHPYIKEFKNSVGAEECKYFGEHVWRVQEYESVENKAKCVRCGLRKPISQLNNSEYAQLISKNL